MLLHELLAARADEVMTRWQKAVHGKLAPESLSPFELQDHLPLFVQEVIVALREAAGDLGPSASSSTSSRATGGDTVAAAGHGEQRLRLGFSLDAVVREYGTMRDAILETVRAAGAAVSYDDMQIVFDCSISAIARAVTEYTQQRDAELQRHANEHFAFIAHELRNPLASALSAFQLLEHRGQLPAEDRFVGALGRGLRRTTDLIEQTLHTARVASGIELNREATLLSAVIGDVEAGSVSDAHQKGIEVRVNVADDQEMFVDVRLVRSALGNLLRNAVKYSHDGAVIELRGSVTNERAVIEVEDGCGGLAPGQVESAFSPFVRLDTKQEGFGLGLAIAKQAADAHGGSIRVQNLPGKGCIFVLELPLGGEAVSHLES